MKKIAILIFMMSLGIANLNAQPLTVASLFELKETANSLLTEAGNIVDRQRQQAFIDMSALISYSFDRLDGTLDELDRKLTKKERALYAELDKIILQAEKAVEEQRIELFEDLDKSIGNAIADLPFTKNNPYPTTIITPFIGKNSTGTFKIKVKGVRLNNDKNYAEINGVKSTQTYVGSKDELTIELPIDQASLKIGSENVIKVVLHKKRKEFKFEIPFWVYPEKFAKITFYYTYTKNITTTSNHNQRKNMRSANACSWTHNSSNIPRVNQGQWSIDVNSVRVREIGQAPGGGDCSIESITPTLIGTKVTARSDCRGTRRFNPDRGTTTCEYTWIEKLVEPKEFDAEISVELTYNDSRALTDFQYGITRFKKAVIEYYNGQTFEFIDNAYDNGFIEYYYDGSREAFQVKSTFQDFGT
jgi:hypothetical protein